MFGPVSSFSVVPGAAAPRWADADESADAGARLIAPVHPVHAEQANPAAIQVEISAAARAFFNARRGYTFTVAPAADRKKHHTTLHEEKNPEDPSPGDTTARRPEELTPAERRVLAHQRQAEAAVRAREQAHLAVYTRALRQETGRPDDHPSNNLKFEI